MKRIYSILVPSFAMVLVLSGCQAWQSASGVPEKPAPAVVQSPPPPPPPAAPKTPIAVSDGPIYTSTPYGQPAPQKQLILSDSPVPSSTAAATETTTVQRKQIILSNGPDVPAFTPITNSSRTTPPLWSPPVQPTPAPAPAAAPTTTAVAQPPQGKPIVTSDSPPAVAPMSTPVAIPTPAMAPAAVSVPIPTPVQKPTFAPFVIYSDRSPRRTHYVPSGYMGDDMSMSGAYIITPRGNEGPCLKIIYPASGPKGWAGLLWQDPANNWGDAAGREGYDLRGATQVIFWARGDNGGERIHSFRMGGIVGSYPDSDVASTHPIVLTKDWKQYKIDLKGKDLRHIVGGFGFLVQKADNIGGITFYLNDIYYVGPEGLPAVPESTVLVTPPAPSPTAVTTTTPVMPAQSSSSSSSLSSSSSAALEPVLPPAAKDLKVKSTDVGLRVSFSSQLHFTPAHASLEPTSSKILDELIALLAAYPTNKVLIEGHTDSLGDSDRNLTLSRLRAASVRDYLIKQGGYDVSRFRIVGYGDTHPIADNDTKEGRSLNRRVEVTILKTASEAQ